MGKVGDSHFAETQALAFLEFPLCFAETDDWQALTRDDFAFDRSGKAGIGLMP